MRLAELYEEHACTVGYQDYVEQSNGFELPYCAPYDAHLRWGMSCGEICITDLIFQQSYVVEGEGVQDFLRAHFAGYACDLAVGAACEDYLLKTFNGQILSHVADVVRVLRLADQKYLVLGTLMAELDDEDNALQEDERFPDVSIDEPIYSQLAFYGPEEKLIGRMKRQIGEGFELKANEVKTYEVAGVEVIFTRIDRKTGMELRLLMDFRYAGDVLAALADLEFLESEMLLPHEEYYRYLTINGQLFGDLLFARYTPNELGTATTVRDFTEPSRRLFPVYTFGDDLYIVEDAREDRVLTQASIPPGGSFGDIDAGQALYFPSTSRTSRYPEMIFGWIDLALDKLPEQGDLPAAVYVTRSGESLRRVAKVYLLDPQVYSYESKYSAHVVYGLENFPLGIFHSKTTDRNYILGFSRGLVSQTLSIFDEDAESLGEQIGKLQLESDFDSLLLARVPQEVLHDKTLLRLTSEGRVEVYRFLRGEVKPTLKELADQHGFAYEDKWNTRQLGAKMIQHFGDGHEARIGSYFFRRLESGTIDGFETINTVKDELHAVAASLGVAVDSTKSLEELAAQLIAASPATSSGTASASVASAEDAASTRAAEIERFFQETGIRLPDNLVVEGYLDLEDNNRLTTLPAGLTVEGYLNLRDCTGLIALPEGLKVEKDLYLIGCTRLTALPDGLTVEGYLDLSDCTGLTALPEGLKFEGGLNLKGCTGLTALPAGLTVGKGLNLRGCTGLTALPDGLKVEGYLDLRGCTGLTALPAGLTVGGYLDLSDCTGLTALPEGLKFEEGLNLKGCTGLTALPAGLTVGEDLNLRGCTGLTTLPDGLTVEGYLDLRDCTGLTALPEGLKVGEDLNLRGCTGLTTVPATIQVGGEIIRE